MRRRNVQRLSGGQAQLPQDALDIDITLIAKLQFALCASDGAGKPRRPCGEKTNRSKPFRVSRSAFLNETDICARKAWRCADRVIPGPSQGQARGAGPMANSERRTDYA